MQERMVRALHECTGLSPWRPDQGADSRAALVLGCEQLVVIARAR